MDFSGLVKAVQEFWNFIWPPIVCITVLYGISVFLAPSSLQAAWSHLARLRPSSDAQVAAFKTIKRFGFDKLVPVLAAFCLLFAFDGVRNLVVEIGQLLPPNIICDQERMVLAHGDSLETRTLWYRTGSPENLSEFYGRIERAVSDAKETHKNSPILVSMESWQKKSGDAHVAFSACKFFMWFALLVGLIEMKISRQYARTGFRVGVVMFLFASLSVFMALRYVWAVEQTFFSTTRAAQLFLPTTGPQCELAKDGCKEYFAFVDASRTIWSAPDRWWFIAGSDFYYIGWLKQQVIHQLE